MEYLDYYDYEGNLLGSAPRDEVHRDGLWHNTVHCWLYDKSGNVFFQIRADSKKLYTTASGHVLKGESVKTAFKREIKEEIGANIDVRFARLINISVWQMDKERDGIVYYKDRAKAHVYASLYRGKYDDFSFDNSEVLGLVLVKATDALSLFNGKKKSIPAQFLKEKDEKIVTSSGEVTTADFLVLKDETTLSKYGNILEKIISFVKE